MAAPTLADVKSQLNITSTTFDTELTFYLSAAQAMVEQRVGKFTVTAFTETVNTRGNAILLTNRPVASVTSVVPLLNTWPSFASTDLSFDSKSGTVWRKDLGTLAGAWTVSYTAGLSSISDNIRLATLVVVQHLWRTQRGGSTRPSLGGMDPETMTSSVGSGYAFPWMAAELLQPDALVQGIG